MITPPATPVIPADARRMLGIHNVKAYGAIGGSGSADDTTAIQSAINAASIDSPISRVVYFPAGIYRVTSTLQVSAPGVVFRGCGKGSYSFYGGSELRLSTTGIPLIQLGTDSGNAYDSNEYNGVQGFEVADMLLVFNGTFTPLSNGQGLGYGTGTIGIRDWRGGDIRLRTVEIKQFDYAVWAIQSDFDHFDGVDLRYCHSGIYLGPRSDQATLNCISSLYCDQALWLDGVFQVRVTNSEFVGDGSASINPIRIGSQWSRLTENIAFENCWFEHEQGVVSIEAFVSLGVSETYATKNVVFLNSHVFINPQGGANYAQYFIKIDNADFLHVQQYGKASAMGGLAAIILDVGNANKNMTITADLNLATIAYSNAGSSTHTPLFIGLNGGVADGFYLMRGSTGETVMRVRRNADTADRFILDDNGVLIWGGGSLGTAADTRMYRNSADQLKTDDALVVADALTVKTKAGVPADGDFLHTPADGTFELNTSNNRMYVRSTNLWLSQLNDGSALQSFLRSGLYYFTALGGAGTSTSATLGNGNFRCTTFYVPQPVTLTRIGAEITSAGDSGSKFRIGIYADDGTGYPGALVLDCGTIAADSATVQEITISQALNPGVYWVGGAVQLVTTTQPTLRTYSVVAGPIGLSAIPGANASTLGFLQGSVTGALGSPFTSSVGSSGSMPRIFVKVA